MSNTTTTTRSPSISTSKSDKGKKSSKIVILHLAPDQLSRFDPKLAKEENPSSSEAPTPAAAVHDIPTLQIEASTDAVSESNSTPAPNGDPTTNGEPVKKRKGPAPGFKRNPTLTVDGQVKPRGKPGPKKKPRLEDGTIDHSAKPAAATTAGQRLGPKAAEKAINAGLRALDRSGAPCRRWARKPFQVKSFTGVMWDVPSWKGGEKTAMTNGDSSSEMKDTSQPSTSDVKPANSDVAMSNTGDPMAISTPMASSPPPLPEQPAVVSAQG